MATDKTIIKGVNKDKKIDLRQKFKKEQKPKMEVWSGVEGIFDERGRIRLSSKDLIKDLQSIAEWLGTSKNTTFGYLIGLAAERRAEIKARIEAQKQTPTQS